MSIVDLELNRQLTKQFIDALPTTITLTPRERVQTPAGGWIWQLGTPREPLVVSLLEQGTVSGLPEPIRTEDGVERRVEFQLLAEWGAPVARGDVFIHSGKEWEVVDLFFDNGYEVRALVSARG